MKSTIKTKLNLIQHFNDEMKKLLEYKVDGFTLLDVIKEKETADSPILEDLISEMFSRNIDLFHVSGKNYIHNHHYRDYITSIAYNKHQPWKENIRNNSIHGTDNYGCKKPDTEFKSRCVAKEKESYYIQLNTQIGEIDKLHTRNENDKIYGPNSDNALCAMVFNTKGNECIYGVYVSQEEFGKVIYEEIKKHKALFENKSNGFQKKARDSMIITIGMIIKCKSFKIFNINTKYRIIYNIAKEENENCYNDVAELLGDTEYFIKSRIQKFSTNDKIITTYSNEGGNIFDVSNFTMVEMSFSKVNENEDFLNKDLICSHYHKNELIFISKVKNAIWRPLFDIQKNLYDSYNKELFNGKSTKEIKKLMEEKEHEFQKDIVRADTFRIKSKDITEFEICYVNKEMIDVFKIKKSRNKLWRDVFNQIEEIKNI